MQQAFDASFDEAFIFHAFTDYMRDGVYVYNHAPPSTDAQASFVRWLFTGCVEARVTSTVTDEAWPRSLDDRLVNCDPGDPFDGRGFMWSVRWQCLYPGATIIQESALAAAWTRRIGVPFHEAAIETNVHAIQLVYMDLEVSEVPAGHAPFSVEPD
jgi:hypothetical protein